MRYCFLFLCMMIFHGILHAQNVIDIHCHNVLPEFRALLEQHDAAMEETFPLPEWSVEAHLRFMEEAGISLSVLSMPAPQPWFGNAEECGRTIRDYNEFCARLKAAHPDKFRFCASLRMVISTAPSVQRMLMTMTFEGRRAENPAHSPAVMNPGKTGENILERKENLSSPIIVLNVPS